MTAKNEALPRWRVLLADEINRTSVTDTAKRIGYARASVSLANSGKYTASTDRIEARVLEILGGPEPTFFCPAQGTSITQRGCDTFCARPMPTASPRALRQWQICQSCIHREDCKNVE
ncbi:hypothetical protein [Thalassospira sp. MCCC 1A01428]|uniref:hypothetical protein n=1 Tax=Thalassospira sp. MCCC 1A01428 TaxID=1470575 RepID=UPI001AEF96B5|nr:hypothetical protein [Thalassospira sp. MCCC 1A01428]